MSLRTSIKHLRRITSVLSPPPHHYHHHRESPPQQDPHSLLKEDPIQVVSNLWVRAFSDHQTHKPFTNLTGFLSKLDLWVLAYQRTCAHVTGSFPPRHALAAHLLRDLLSLRNAVVSGQFLWNSNTHIFVRNPNHKFTPKRSLQSADFQDRIVQEVLLLILEPIFESRFSPKSHAFRPGRSLHTVIRTVRSNFAGYLWFLRGDVSGIFEDVDVNLLLGCVGEAVKDKKVLALIKLAFRGQIKNVAQRNSGGGEEFGKKRKKKQTGSRKRKILSENEAKPDPYWLRTFDSFAPEEAAKVPNYGYCGILSPLFANVCLNELDRLTEEKIVEFFRPSKLDSIWKDSIDDGSHNPAWPEFVPSSGEDRTRKMDYIRYGGHFLIGIRGPREEAVRIRKEIIEFCESKYGLKLDNSKVEIEHISRGIQFLDHIICLRVIHPTLRYTASGGEIVSKKGVGTLLSVTASLQQCIRQLRKLELIKGDKDPEPLPCTPMLYSGQAHTNEQMNKFLETMADWYRYADNRKKVVAFFAYVIRSSLAKLYAARYGLKSRAKVYKIASRDLSRPLRMSSNSSVPEYSDLLKMGLVDAIEGVQFSRMSLIPSCDYTPFPRNWVPDHERVLREYIRLQDPKLFGELHKAVKREGLRVPQDEISEILWDCKTHGIRRFLSNPDGEMKHASKNVLRQP
ncbi:nuclear intron maturase 1, mitochondrial [Actinidia eriantha]|uniref:nuclear intron maturase 1, mitochondrial n=1 Tax=Actinidia eriantha TaxID=165200 RepID=UPI002588F76F|nr:nuclear intron maturase 1, mitochondrial [Actinidia eriantha]XP_057466301.1 nuclear intron maturase 1, mitochondrial [Actinidia eriantha]XP_057466302.1 nuclear intron maturase 1, mitochondrial [Actinidia eriantha]XP_057466303.1 nuclear intron maturase 1, mitochondrial [Actinidia eriantha]XP_057466304.1 nuclear intron maturase 1, mitochondrial [Actinidia eriantha]XP_057466305.1 nuclear intron maturase 1, mitochondrial [Actinidia eriantha]XP_057466306.1 nuclear intron maturase 1, mitochondri